MIVRRLMLASACAVACAGGDAAPPRSVRPTPSPPATYALGAAPSDSLVRSWDRDVNPAGVGLPPGRGTYASGQATFAAKCATCHGARGEGITPYPALVGRDPRDGFRFATDTKVVKTVGNYWPYATTLFDYVQRAMPQLQPGSLTPDELYGLCAFILAENEIIAKDAVVDATTLPKVRMPSRDRFVPDDRLASTTVR